jgi:hypothetical protein
MDFEVMSTSGARASNLYQKGLGNHAQRQSLDLSEPVPLNWKIK